MVLLIGAALPATACELDGLSHGYGPMSALFAGAHRYQSLNGLEDEEPPPEAPPPEPAEQTKADDELRPSPGTAPPTQPRSFVAWAKAKPKVPGTGDAPAAWVRGPVQDAAESSNAKPESAER
jgi:predicted component of type VI protein secretion system